MCKSVLLITLAFVTVTLNAQNQKADCSALKGGIFYSYPKNSADKYLTKREGEYQYERNLYTGDTMVYKIEWLSGCKYALRFVSTNAKLTADEKDFWQGHKLVYDIITVTEDYYTFKGYIDKTSNLPISTDTMWIKEKPVAISNELIQPVKSEMALKKAHFSDTSKYAVLYIYRTGRFAASLVDMFIYFDDNLICDSENKSAFIFKVVKEGNYKLMSVSNMNKKSVELPLSIKFGQKYYVNSSAKFAMNMKSTYIPLLTLVDAEKGEDEFLNAY